MAYRVAFASSDGKVINQQFGRVKKYMIFEIDENKAEYVEVRKNKLPSQGFEQTEKVINRTVSLISDCKAVFVTAIGYGALAILHEKGIKVFEGQDYIGDIIGKILSSSLEV